MTRKISLRQALNVRLSAQRLNTGARQPRGRVAEIVRDLGGIQAQEAHSVMLALWVRNQELSRSQIEDARLKRKSIVRTWCMRGTLHLIAAEDLSWLLSLLGPLFIRRSRRRYAQLGLDEETCSRAVQLISEALDVRGPMTRVELADHLAARGIPVEGQATYHLIRRAGLAGVLCFGPDEDGEPTFAAMAAWVTPGDPLAEDEALGALVGRYLNAYGPAGLKDIAAWSGLPLSQIRLGLQRVRQSLLAVELDGAEAWLPNRHRSWLDEPHWPTNMVRLLPAYDPYLLGYRNRDLMVEAAFARRIHPGGGLIRPTLIVDGRAQGIWRSKRRRGRLEIVVQSFGRLEATVVAAIEREVAALGRFYETDATLVLP